MVERASVFYSACGDDDRALSNQALFQKNYISE
jgi:hypothetical protein